MVIKNDRVEFQKPIFKQVWLDDEHTSCTYEYLGDVRYVVDYIDDEHLRFWRGVQSKVVFIKRDYDFAYKAQKTQIKAIGGARRLFDEYACDEFWDNIVKALADHAIDVMRPARGYELAA